MTKKAVCFLRVSTEEQVNEGVSLDNLEEKIKAYCLIAGLQVEAIIREEGVSAGKKLSDRPGGEATPRPGHTEAGSARGNHETGSAFP